MDAVYLKGQGLPHQEICRLTRISENTLRSYLRQYQEGGIERLQRTDWAGATSDLDDHRQSLEDYFRENPPRSTGEAAAVIEQRTGIRRGPTQVRRFLKGMGLRFRKLGMIPAKADAAEQAEFLDEKLWPRLRQAQRLRRVVCFVDAAHFVHGAFLGYLWCFVRLLVRRPSGRKRFNVLGAIDAVSHELTTVVNETVIDAMAVTGRFKTSHSWALQNQPRFLCVSDTFVDPNRIDSLFKVSGDDRPSFSSRQCLPRPGGSVPLRAFARPRDGSDGLPRGLTGAGGRLGWF